jgi:hypothetical protein
MKDLYGGILEKHAELLVPATTDKYLSQILEDLVMKQVQDKIPGHLTSYLDNNNAMQDIIKRHEAKLRSRLNDEATKVLTELVRKDDYHIVNKGYFDEFKRRGENVTATWLQNNGGLQNKVTNLSNQVESLNKQLNSLFGCIGFFILGIIAFVIFGFISA